MGWTWVPLQTSGVQTCSQVPSILILQSDYLIFVIRTEGWRCPSRPNLHLCSYLACGQAAELSQGNGVVWHNSSNIQFVFLNTPLRFDAHKALFESQFSTPSSETGLVVQDGPCDFFNYSTGRRGLRSLHTTVRLLPRQDVLSALVEFGWILYDLRYTPKDEIQLNFTLHPDSGTPGLVWAIFKKDEMTQMRRERFDLVRVNLRHLDICRI